MKKLIVLASLALATGVVLLACELGAKGASVAVATASAEEMGGGKGCTFIGSWATEPDAELVELEEPPPWLCTVSGASASSGTIVCDVPHWPNVTLFGLRAAAARVTTLRGVWERTGGNTFAFTQVGWAVNAVGDAVYVVRNSGRSTVTGDCDLEVVESTMEFLELDLEPILDPGTEEPIALPLSDMVGHRIELTPPPLPLD